MSDENDKISDGENFENSSGGKESEKTGDTRPHGGHTGDALISNSEVPKMPENTEKVLCSKIAECQTIIGDLKTSQEVIEAALTANEKDTIILEMDDINNYEKQYADAHISILEICTKYNIEPKEYEERRSKFLFTLKLVKARAKRHVHGSVLSAQSDRSADISSRLKFAKIDIKEFDGKKENWNAFKRLFISYIHDNTLLSDMEKHQFLSSRLVGEAHTLIEDMPLDGTSYRDAWRIVLAHYDDPLKRVARHLDAIFESTKISLRKLITVFRANEVALKTCFRENPNVDALSQFYIHAFLNRADKGTRLDWEREVQKRQSFATFSEFLVFMDGRCNAYERAVGRAADSIPNSSSSEKKSNRQSGHSFTVKSGDGNSKRKTSCYYCNQESHFLHRCLGFQKISAVQRNEFIKSKGLCQRCFKPKSSCKRTCTFLCKNCNGCHHTLLHVDEWVKKISTDNAKGESSTCKTLQTILNDNKISNSIDTKFHVDQEFCGWVGSVFNDNLYSLLATAIVNVDNKVGKGLDARALLDSGSQFNFITYRLATQLGLQSTSVSYQVNFLHKKNTILNKMVSIKITSKYSNFSLNIKCLVIDYIVDQVPNEYLNIENWQFPNYLSLADKTFNIPGSVDLLLGLGIFWKILKPSFKDLNTGAPRLYATHFGWLVTGDVNLAKSKNSSTSNYAFLNSYDKNLSQIIEKFWLLDENSEKGTLSFEENECERLFLETCTRNSHGRFVVTLPFKLPPEKLGKSKLLAEKRLNYLERKLAKNENFKLEYTKCINDYISQGHLVEIGSNCLEEGYYIPHHAVIKETSSTTKLRVVFDGSMISTSGVSLNDCLYAGPVVQSNLLDIIIRSRIHKYIFSSDISQMYRQILVADCDTKYQRILWRRNSDGKVSTFELKTVTFGLTCSPYLATRCLKKLAEESTHISPDVMTALLKDCYIDDIFTGSDSLSKLINLRKQLTQLLASAGFHLSKWCSNNAAILEGIPAKDLEKKFSMFFGNEMAIKTLGLLWQPLEDVFCVWVHTKEPTTYTKREVLSIISSIFDPLGFLGPVCMTAKLFMQALWIEPGQNKKRLGWDEVLPENQKQQWLLYSSQLNELNSIHIPRYLFREANRNFVEIHGFCDASEKGYGAVLYVRSSSSNDYTLKLLCSKSRVAPLKQISLPKLELCGAELLADLTHTVKRIFGNRLSINLIRLWTDSIIVLHWIKSPANRWQTFVANRVQRIQDNTKNYVWDHVKSECNPADPLSRGLLPKDLINCDIWWNGPEWLRNNIPFTEDVKFNVSQNDASMPEIRKSRQFVNLLALKVSQSTKFSIFDEFSTYTKLIRMAAWRMRLIWNMHWAGPKLTGPLKVLELNWSLSTLTKMSQQEYFSEDLKLLKKGENVAAKSSLASLSPFLDAQGLIRVGGRLQNASLTWDQKFPIILHPNHKLAQLLIKYEHLNHLHAGPQLLRSVLRRKFWILRINSAIRSCTMKCHTCIRLKADTRTQFMATLPHARVTPGKVFQNTGVDYLGPFKLLQKGGRHKILLDAYVAVFVCMATKAIHLEMISDLTSDTFLAGLSRFISRRGLPAEMWSDNSTTFTGAKTKLAKLSEFFKANDETISRFMADKNIKWHFIPPHAPNFGGLWEAGVKSVKAHLRAVLKNTLLTYEQYETLLLQVEACLNSRPLTLESTDPNEFGALTPGHFLIGGPITALPNTDFTSIPLNRLKYWELISRKTQDFWRRWSTEYLNTLHQRSKWRIVKENIKVGDVVIVREDNSPPTHWPIALITETHPGNDGKIRVVTLRMRVGNFESLKNNKGLPRMTEFRRPVNKIVYLPTAEL